MWGGVKRAGKYVTTRPKKARTSGFCEHHRPLTHHSGNLGNRKTGNQEIRIAGNLGIGKTGKREIRKTGFRDSGTTNYYYFYYFYNFYYFYYFYYYHHHHHD